MNQVYPINSVENFSYYNENCFAIDFLSKHIHSDIFSQLSVENKLIILRKYKEILISKAFIDEQLFKRQAQIPKNQILLKKLLSKFTEIDATQEDQTDIKNYIQQNIFWQDTHAKLDKTDSPTETTNHLKAQISTVNMHRLDGVWSRNFTNTVLSYKQIQSPIFSAVNEHIATLNGLTSYGFYVVRGGMEIGKLLKHGFSNNSFYSTQGISKLKQFEVQWKLRSAVIINDFVLWAPVNAITYHFWLDMKGNILTAALLLGDLIHSIYNYFVCTQRFAHLKSLFPQAELQEFVAQMEQEHQKNLSKQKYFMSYQFLLLSAFSTICGFFLNWASATQLNFALIGGLVCFSIQFFVNLIDSIFELKTTNDVNERNVIYFKMASRILLQASIPALFISSSFLLPMLELNLPMTFVTLSLLAMSAFLVKLTNDINELFTAYMSNYNWASAQQKLQTIKTGIQEELRKAQPDGFIVNSKIEHWFGVYQKDFQKTHAYEFAKAQLQKDLAYGLSLISFISSSALIFNASLPLLTITLSLMSLFSFAAATQIQRPKLDERKMTETLNRQLSLT